MKRLITESALEKFLLLFYCTGSLVFLGVFYNNHLYQKEQLQLFETTFQYLVQKISHQGGLADYISEFFIQFFHLPFMGAFVITVAFFLMQRMFKKILQITVGKPPTILFCFLPALGYWILLLNDFYCLSGEVGLLLALLATLIYLNVRNTRVKSFIGIFLLFIVYWFTGGAYILYAVIILISELIFRLDKREKQNNISLLFLLLFFLLAILLPLVVRGFIIKDTVFQSYISESYYKIRIFFPLPLILIFSSFPLFILIQNFIPDQVSEKQLNAINALSVAVLFTLTIWGVIHNGDFKAESQIAYDNLVYKEEWGKIIKRAEKEQPSDQISLVAINLALAKEGDLSSKMFMFHQTKSSLFIDYKRRGMTPFITGEPYYYLGLFNFAQMFAMETLESTPDTRFPSRSFRRIAETYIINGQYDIALKYLTPLSHTLFYRKWAKECISLLNNEERINSHPYWGYMRGLRLKYDFYYDPGKNDIALSFLLVSNPENKTVFEYLMAYYLLQKDFDGFLAGLPYAERLNYNKLPLVWQEAAAYIETRVQQVPVQLMKYSISNDIIANIRAYAEQFSSNKQDTMKIQKEFGNTYWYYLHFR